MRCCRYRSLQPMARCRRTIQVVYWQHDCLPQTGQAGLIRRMAAVAMAASAAWTATEVASRHKPPLWPARASTAWIRLARVQPRPLAKHQVWVAKAMMAPLPRRRLRERQHLQLRQNTNKAACVTRRCPSCGAS